MNALNAGELAPDFQKVDLNGNIIHLSDYQGKKVLLSFFRYATCPFCTVRFARLIQEMERYSEKGIQIISVFESSPEYIQRYLSRRGIPFPVIPDPQGELYAKYGIKKSLTGLMLGMFRMPTLLRALFDPEYHMGKPDADITRIPADFLIGTNQVIVDSYYGSDIGDHISFKRIDSFSEQKLPTNIHSTQAVAQNN